jgi:hypothetical protein
LGMFLSRVSRMKYSKYPNQTAHLDLKQSVSTKNGSLGRLPFFVAKMVQICLNFVAHAAAPTWLRFC